ncbi:MAG: sigma-54-dependent Fis family transcriptional regulator [Planctomycetota bacterium]|nr:MAG: sigma-54-dependent Fis family transcriptional regulator [Planctomycetota bacterium]
MSRILIVDDEPAIGWSLRELLADGGHAVELASSVEAALDTCRRFEPDTVLLDVRLPGRDGLSAIPDLRALAPGVPVIVMTAFGDLDTAVRAVHAGAFDYLVKPFDMERIAEVVDRALAERSGAAREAAAEQAAPAARLVGMAPPMQELFKQIALVAATDLPVLIEGETGTGKELAARAIHDHGGRRDRPFVATNLAALAPGIVESELFGHVRGAFTGATADRPGLFELADGGTIFLDEIGDAPADVQVKILRTLESGAVTRVGSVAARPVDVRVIAATNRDLVAALRAGRFREDLYHRLRVFPIGMPALADRRQDIEPLARHFLARHLARQTPAALPPALSSEFLAALHGRDWPGNVRELKHAVEYAAVVARGGTLRPEHLPQVSRADAPAGGGGVDAAGAAVGDAVREWAAAARLAFGGLAEPDLHHRAVQLVEATLLREALAHAGGNRTAAAKLLGLDRATLRTKLRALGIDD